MSYFGNLGLALPGGAINIQSDALPDQNSRLSRGGGAISSQLTEKEKAVLAEREKADLAKKKRVAELAAMSEAERLERQKKFLLETGQTDKVVEVEQKLVDLVTNAADEGINLSTQTSVQPRSKMPLILGGVAVIGAVAWMFLRK